MRVPFFSLEAQTDELHSEFEAAFRDVCQSGQYTLGPNVEQFERNFSTYCEAEYCVAVNSGTSALHLSLAALGVGPGDEVITVPMTFVATSWAISYTGATPVFVDIDPQTWTMDPQLLERAITPKTRAIIPVHLYGRPADMTSLVEIADRHGLPVIEDAAQAHGARHHGRRAGSLGTVGCFSFYPSKNLGALGEGGAVVTSNAELATRLRALRNHAQFDVKNVHQEMGFNYRMDTVQAAMLDIKLRRLDQWNESRRQVAATYLDTLHGLTQLQLPAAEVDEESVYHLFVVQVERREQIARQLQDVGVGTGTHYPRPVHLQPAYQRLKLPEGSFPHAERLAANCLSLPMFPEMSSEAAAYVCEQLTRVLLESDLPAAAPPAMPAITPAPAAEHG